MQKYHQRIFSIRHTSVKFFIGLCLVLILVFQLGNMLIKKPSVEKAYAATTITFDNQSVAEADGNGTTSVGQLQWQHTTGSGSNMILLVDIETDTSGGPDPVTGVTYNGKPLIKLTSVTSGSSNPPNATFERWYLTSPPSGANLQVTVTLNTSFNEKVVGGASTYYNVNQATPFGTIVTTPSFSNSITLQPTDTSQLIVDAAASRIYNTCGACSPPTLSGGGSSWKLIIW